MDWKSSDPFIRVGFVAEKNKAKLDKTLEKGTIGGVLYQSKVISSELACSFDTKKTVLGNFPFLVVCLLILLLIFC